MARLPKARRGVHEALSHYLQRLETAKQGSKQFNPTYQWGTFLSGYQWDWFCTFTFKSVVSEQTAIQLFTDYLESCGNPFSFFSVERSPGRVHVHCLIGNCRDLRLKNEWPYGVADIRAYDKNKAAAHYVAKSKLLEWDWFGSRKINPVR